MTAEQEKNISDVIFSILKIPKNSKSSSMEEKTLEKFAVLKNLAVCYMNEGHSIGELQFFLVDRTNIIGS